MPTASSTPTATAANTPAVKTRRLLKSYHLFGDADQEKLITLFSSAVSPDENEDNTAQNNAFSDDKVVKNHRKQ